MNTAKHTIAADRLSLVVARLADLNKRGAKYEMPALVLTAGEPYRVKAVCEGGVERFVWVLDLTLTGDVPKINGYTFLASLEHSEAGNLILKAPAAQDRELTAWQHCSARCQHCGLDRDRKTTFLLETPEGGIIQIARNCLADYLRSDDIERTLRWFSVVSECVRDMDEEYGYSGNYWPTATPLEYVAAAVSSVRKFGFKKAAEECNTRMDCDFLTNPPPMGHGRDAELARKDWTERQPTPAQIEQAQAAIAWCLATTDNSDYMHSLRVACSTRTISDRARGLLASLPTAYAREQGKLNNRAPRVRNAPHYGAIGEKFDMEVEVVYHTPYTNDFGTGTMLIMRNVTNHVFMVFTAGTEIGKMDDFSGKWHLRATVKRHDQDRRNGEPVTLVKRPQLSRTPFKPAKAKRAKVAA